MLVLRISLLDLIIYNQSYRKSKLFATRSNAYNISILTIDENSNDKTLLTNLDILKKLKDSTKSIPLVILSQQYPKKNKLSLTEDIKIFI